MRYQPYHFSEHRHWQAYDQAMPMNKTFLSLAVPVLLVGATIAVGKNWTKTMSETTSQLTSSPQAPKPLKDSYKDKFRIGAAVSTAILRGQDAASEQMLRRHFDSVTAENAMKPDAMQPREGEFTFEDADRLVKIAEESGAEVVGHTLVWHSQTPRWFFEGKDGQPLTKELALERLRTHIKTVVGRYKGKIREWDVVNEAINDGPGVLRQTPWLRAIGEEYIAEAFKAAHEADPDAILVYNDYNIELDYKRPKAIELLKKLIDAKVPIHAVGIQSHWRMQSPPFSEAEKAIKEFSALGLKVMITEYDMGVLPTQYQGADLSRAQSLTPEQLAVLNPYTKGLPEEAAKEHADKVRQSFELFLKYKENIGRVTLWGIHDGHSWLNNFPIRGRTDYPMLFDRELKPKPAFFAVVKAAEAAGK